MLEQRHLKIYNEPIKSKVFFNDNLKVMSQHKRHSLSPYTKLDLEVTEEVPIVNVEELATLCHHDVVRVAVSNTQHIRSNTVTSTRPAKPFSSLLQSKNKTPQCKLAHVKCPKLEFLVHWYSCIKLTGHLLDSSPSTKHREHYCPRAPALSGLICPSGCWQWFQTSSQSQ